MDFSCLAQSRGTRSPPGISSRSSAETDLYLELVFHFKDGSVDDEVYCLFAKG